MDLSWALVSALVLAPAGHEVPTYCGAVAMPIGNGFLLTEFMSDRSPEFTLEYQIPATDIRLKNAVSGPSNPRLKFGGLPQNVLNSPRLGFSKFDVRETDGWALNYRVLSFECGNGVSLHSPSIGGDHVKPGPSEFDSPFFDNRVRGCIDALRRSGHYRFVIKGTGNAQFEAEGKLPLQLAFDAERVFRQSELRRARTGRCRIMPAPPPPF